MPEPFRQATFHFLPMKDLSLLVIRPRLHGRVVTVFCKQRPDHGAWSAGGDEPSGYRDIKTRKQEQEIHERSVTSRIRSRHLSNVVVLCGRKCLWDGRGL